VKPSDINEAIAAAWPEARCVCEAVSPTSASARIDLGTAEIRPGGYISGPAQFAAADSALWFLTFGAAGRIEPLALTGDLSIRFLAPAQGLAIHARADLNRATARTVIGTVTLWTPGNEVEPCATAQGSYVLPKPTPR